MTDRLITRMYVNGNPNPYEIDRGGTGLDPLEIVSGTNLNDCDEIGNYYCKGSSVNIINIPLNMESVGFSLEVRKISENYLIQILYTIKNGKSANYTRIYYNDIWSDWTLSGSGFGYTIEANDIIPTVSVVTPTSTTTAETITSEIVTYTINS